MSLAALLAALAVLYGTLFAVVRSAAFARAPGPLALGVTLDLTVTAALVVWWLGVRRAALPSWFAVAALSWGVAMARAWVPRAPLSALVAVGGALEVVATGWLLLRVGRVVRGARAAREEGPVGMLEAGLCAASLPARVAAILAAELAVVWLAITGWFRRPAPGALGMRSTGWLLTAGVLSFLIASEAAAAHVALGMWSPTAAWISTVSSIYGLVWLAGDAQAIRLYPVEVAGAMLRIRVGVRWRGSVPLSAISSIARCTVVPEGVLDLSLMVPTVMITLEAPVEMRGLLGRRRSADRIALTIDTPDALIAVWKARADVRGES